jgi:PIN domain nuclease of toxin-antitoxin system
LKALVDTHVLLWFIAGDGRLSSEARAVVEATSAPRLFSIASLWEIAIKVSLGRLELPTPHGPFVRRVLGDLGMQLLGISAEHVERVASLPFHQVMHEGIPLVTQDPQFARYDIAVIG